MKERLIINLFKEYKDELYLYALKFTKQAEDAEDLVQEAFLRLLRCENIHKYTSLKPLVLIAIKNLFFDKCRRAKKYKYIFMDSALNEIECVNQKNSISIEHLANTLPNRFKLPFLLFEYGYTYNDISATLEISRNSVGSYISQARKRLSTYFK